MPKRIAKTAEQLCLALLDKDRHIKTLENKIAKHREHRLKTLRQFADMFMVSNKEEIYAMTQVNDCVIKLKTNKESRRFVRVRCRGDGQTATNEFILNDTTTPEEQLAEHAAQTYREWTHLDDPETESE